jgi:hypothetical protein
MTMGVGGMLHEESMRARHRGWREMSGGKKVLVVAGFMALAAAGLALIGFVAMLLWNRIMSGILGLPALGFLDAMGLFILCRIFLGGRGGSFIGRMRMRRAMRERMARRAEEREGTQD